MHNRKAISASSKNLRSCSAKPVTLLTTPNPSSIAGKISFVILSFTSSACSASSSESCPVTVIIFWPSSLVTDENPY